MNNTTKRITWDLTHIKLLANKNRHTTRSVSTKKDNEDQLIFQIITGVKNTSSDEYGLEGGVIHFTTNGSITQVSATNRSSSSAIRNEPKDLSVVSFDHLGNFRFSRVTSSNLLEGIQPNNWSQRVII